MPGIITHETGHHVNGHTADFFANRNRPPTEKVNIKIHMDEGTADYWAAVVLGTPDIYNWQHVAESLDDRDNRDLRGPRTTDDFDKWRRSAPERQHLGIGVVGRADRARVAPDRPAGDEDADALLAGRPRGHERRARSHSRWIKKTNYVMASP